MKRILSIVLLTAMLLPLVALAGDFEFQALSDEELQAVVDSANQELARRRIADTDYLATGSVAGFFVGVKGLIRGEDFEGRPAFTLLYDLRNNSTEPLNPLMLITVMAFQDGSPSDVTFVPRGGEGLVLPNVGAVKPGEMISEATDYLLSGQGPVKVVVSPLIPDGASLPFEAEFTLP